MTVRVFPGPGSVPNWVVCLLPFALTRFYSLPCRIRPLIFFFLVQRRGLFLSRIRLHQGTDVGKPSFVLSGLPYPSSADCLLLHSRRTGLVAFFPDLTRLGSAPDHPPHFSLGVRPSPATAIRISFKPEMYVHFCLCCFFQERVGFCVQFHCAGIPVSQCWLSLHGVVLVILIFFFLLMGWGNVR